MGSPALVTYMLSLTLQHVQVDLRERFHPLHCVGTFHSTIREMRWPSPARAMRRRRRGLDVSLKSI